MENNLIEVKLAILTNLEIVSWRSEKVFAFLLAFIRVYCSQLEESEQGV